MNLIAITNPSDESAEAGFVHTQYGYITTESIIPDYGDKIEDGAQIVIVSDIDGLAHRVWQFIAERVDDEIWIRVNNTVGDYIDVEDAGPCVAQGNVTPPEPLETYTVFGRNDNCEPFRCVVSAISPVEAYAAAVDAAVVDEGWEFEVRVDIVLKGDVTEADVTGEASEG